MPPPVRTMASLEDRFSLEDGRVFLTGVQALVRVVLDHQRAERRRGRETATFVSGYPGSPLGGFDRELDRQLAVAPELDIVHVPGLNEDLAATAVWGSQLASSLPQPRQKGVLGVWYGKSPGVDRSADSMRHANLSGTGPDDGVLAFVGDDPTSKSSTVPNASEGVLADLGMPVFFPSDVQDVLDLGVHAVACSRSSGLWSTMKIVVTVADSAGQGAEGWRPARQSGSAERSQRCRITVGSGGAVPFRSPWDERRSAGRAALQPCPGSGATSGSQKDARASALNRTSSL